MLGLFCMCEMIDCNRYPMEKVSFDTRLGLF